MNNSIEPTNKNVRIDDLQQQFAVLKAANHIAHLLGKTNVLEQAIEPLINEFIDLVQAECGSIQLLRPGSQQTQRTLVRKCTHGECGFDNRLEDQITGWILKHRSSLLTNDIGAHTKLGAAAKRYASISSLLAVPIMQHDHVIGVVNLIRVQPTSPFTNQHVEMTTALAHCR
ncbi:MAG: GAF domain-containing protein [candidate division KSB1 bacterium]|nr:GAF domain-containing protein [candidate division KSB1 bacterium]MDZ7305075.1 GAF domain-containing protein [candidate division KSB1 bacterium]MDZ7313555.1 GAF domain-containing protein [candidate division KSB1 bacterium]